MKWIAVGIIATLSTGFGAISRYLLGTMRDGIIERENLGDILALIEDANIDTHTLTSVLQEAPPLMLIFIVSLVGTAITIWMYHKILSYLCKSNKTSNQSSEPTLKTPGDSVDV